MKILLTGGSGFIGSHLTKGLVENNGFEVVHINRKGSVKNKLAAVYEYEKLHEIKDIISTIKPDALVHLAALYELKESVFDLQCLLESNISFTTAIFSALAEINCKVAVSIGTVWQDDFGKNKIGNSNFYALTKNFAWQIAHYFCGKNKTRLYGIKLADTFGEYDTRNKIVEMLIRSSLDKKPVALSPGYQQIYLTHVANVTNAVLKLLSDYTNIESGDYHLEGSIVTLRELSCMIEGIIKQKGYHLFGKLDYRENTVLEIDKSFLRILPVKSQVDIEKGIKAYIDSISKEKKVDKVS